MSYKKIIGILLGLSVIGTVTGFVFMAPCYPHENYTCAGAYAEQLGQPFLFGSMVLSLIFLVLLFLSKPYFTAWRNFALWFVPLAALWIATSPTTGGSGMGVGFGFDRELAIMWSSGIYIAVSLLILIITAVRLRKKQDQQLSE